MHWRGRMVEIAQATAILAWLVGASIGVLLTRNQPNGWRELFVHSFIIPILFTSFLYGRLGGLLTAQRIAARLRALSRLAIKPSTSKSLSMP